MSQSNWMPPLDRVDTLVCGWVASYLVFAGDKPDWVVAISIMFLLWMVATGIYNSKWGRSKRENRKAV